MGPKLLALAFTCFQEKSLNPLDLFVSLDLGHARSAVLSKSGDKKKKKKKKKSHIRQSIHCFAAGIWVAKKNSGYI